MQAVVKIGSSQYIVQPGEELLVDRRQEEGKLTLDQVLLVVDGSTVLVGKPHVEGAKVIASISGNLQGKKVRTATYKAKSRYRKVKGFRAQLTKLVIETIDFPGAKPAAPAKESKSEVEPVEKAPKKARAPKAAPAKKAASKSSEK